MKKLLFALVVMLSAFAFADDFVSSDVIKSFFEKGIYVVYDTNYRQIYVYKNAISYIENSPDSLEVAYSCGENDITFSCKPKKVTVKQDENFNIIIQEKR